MMVSMVIHVRIGNVLDGISQTCLPALEVEHVSVMIIALVGMDGPNTIVPFQFVTVNLLYPHHHVIMEMELVSCRVLVGVLMVGTEITVHFQCVMEFLQ